MAHFLLTGKPPFDGGNVAQKLIRHQTAIPAASDRPAPECPPAGRGRRPDAGQGPGRPPASAGRLIAELRPWIAELPPPTPDEMPPTRYNPAEDVDTKARHSTMAILSKSSRVCFSRR